MPRSNKQELACSPNETSWLGRGCCILIESFFWVQSFRRSCWVSANCSESWLIIIRCMHLPWLFGRGPRFAGKGLYSNRRLASGRLRHSLRLPPSFLVDCFFRFGTLPLFRFSFPFSVCRVQRVAFEVQVQASF